MEMRNKRFRITLRQKIISSIFLTYAAFIGYFLYFTVIQEHRVVEQMTSAALMNAGLLSRALSGHLWHEDKTFLRGFVERTLRDRGDIEYILFLDRNRDVLAEGGLRRKRTEHLAKLHPTVDEIGKAQGILNESGHFFDVCIPVLRDGKKVGELHLEVSTREENWRLAKATYSGIAIIVMTLLIGAFLAYFLELRIRGSVRNLIQVTGRMAHGDLHQRVNISIGGEVEELAQSFNRMAQALSEKEKELVVAKNTMVSMFNGITAGIAYISGDHRIIHANRAYKALLKENSELETGKRLRCFEDLWQRHEPCKDCPGRSAMRIGKCQEVEREIVLRNNDRRALRIHAYPVPATPGNPGGFVEYVMDVTQQKRLEAELKSYTEHLEELTEERAQKLKQAQVQIVHQEKMAALGQMAAGVAHEIGNPLSALSSLVRAMEDDLQKNRSNGEKVKSIKEQVDRISKIVRELMDFSRPASHRTTLTNGNQVIHSALGISSYDRRLKEVNVITRLDNEIPALKVDEDQLLQVFLNIVFNAADAMNGAGTLTISSKLQNNSVIFVFEDTGPGIPEHLLSRVFEPFFTTKDVGKGTGLGLSVSYGIMQSMGGLIKAANRQDGGSVFTVKIPLGGLGEGEV